MGEGKGNFRYQNSFIIKVFDNFFLWFNIAALRISFNVAICHLIAIHKSNELLSC